MRNKTPYQNVDWSSYKHIQSISHSHFYPRTVAGYKNTDENNYDDNSARQSRFDLMYNAGIRNFAASNYDPPTPDLYPIEDYVNDSYDMTSYPSCEFAGFGMHFSCLGSTLGIIEYNESANRWKQAYDIYGSDWQTGFTDFLNNMIEPDGGGIVVHHPYRNSTTTTKEIMLKYLNFDERVIALEVFNYRSERFYDGVGMAFDLWDKVLSEGVQCFGTFAQDMHDIWNSEVEGRNVLLVESNTQENCLKAYRQGNFYGAVHGGMVKFTKLEKRDNKVIVETDTGTNIRFIGEGGIVLKESKGNKAAYRIKGNEIYVRVEVDDTDNKLAEGQYWSQNFETIYSQPFIIKDKENKSERILLMA